MADDDEVLRDAVGFRLQKEGYEVLVAGDGQTAGEILVADHPDVLITDILMPGLNGLELIRLAKTRLAGNVPVIVLTAVGSEATMTEAFRLGVEEFLTKPFNPNELLIRLRKVIKGAEQAKVDRKMKD